MKLKSILLTSLCVSTITFTSCSTDDEIPVPDIDRTGSLVIEDQTLMDERLILNSITVNQQSYLVLRKGGPDGEIIAPPRLLSKGESTNITIRLNSGVELNDGDTVTAVLHKDTNNLGRFEFDGESGIDDPITNEAGEIVIETFTVTVMPDPTGSLTIDDQALVNGMLTVESITLDRSGWVVVHASNEDGDGPMVPEIISEPVYLEEGTNTDVQIMIEESAGLMADDVVWVMLHTDTGTEDVYEFDGESGFDKPILNDEGMIVMEAVTITEVMNDATGSLTVNDQVLTNNNINVGSITVGQDSYVVVHASNEAGDGPMVPEIISEPVYLEEGTYDNVVVPLLETADVNEGDTVWVMLHEDTGTEEVYEFDGQNGLDLPIVIDGSIVMESLMITAIENTTIAGRLTVQDQELGEGNTITVESVNLFDDGWVVVHASNEAGDGPMVPEIISEPVYLEAGKHDNVEVTLLDSANVEAGDTVWVMLHNDTGRDAVYEFDGMNGLDLPIVVDGAVVVKPVVITE